MSESAKKPYVEISEADRARYNKEFEEFKSKGYFTMSDGSKSYDVETKAKKAAAAKANLKAKADAKLLLLAKRKPKEESKSAPMLHSIKHPKIKKEEAKAQNSP